MTTIRTGFIMGAVALFGVSTALASPPDPTCMAQARSTKQTCTATCKTGFDQARTLCRNIDPICASGCESQEAACAAPFLSTLQPCVDGVQAQLQADKKACPPPSDATHADCIDAAQLKAFNDRDACHDDPTVSAGLQVCRKAYYTCLKQCPAPQ